MSDDSIPPGGPQQAAPLEHNMASRARLDPDGNPIVELEQEDILQISPSGTLGTHRISNALYHDCGHFAGLPPGGRCAEPGCYRTSCQRCFISCAACNVALCQVHAVRFEKDGHPFALCSECHDKSRRRQFWSRFWRIVLSPFVLLPEPKD